MTVMGIGSDSETAAGMNSGSSGLVCGIDIDWVCGSKTGWMRRTRTSCVHGSGTGSVRDLNRLEADSDWETDSDWGNSLRLVNRL